ncbi:hypothetical protein IV203_015275 [Nitzschia inconspicua]|uniref:Uncharacterized protein n=1 Tax=Nitzschia inconspicua TaxID=303405 RepID=A0A9K3K6A1_9STRA|nr:hypothetical protein IV203_020230 [Nitzschia inconspicua]KAG7358686.1 hypothetical protein IV203_015275 [Nitzschia inconspicua]
MSRFVRTHPKASSGQNGKCQSLTVSISDRTMTMTPLVLEDSRHVTGKGHFALTWTGHPFIATRPGLVNYENDNLIRQLHSKCVSICMEADKSPSRQKAFNGMTKNYLPYQKPRDLIVTDPCTSADLVLIDHSIKTIISAMWEGPDYTKFYNEIGRKRHHSSSLVTKMEDTLTWLLKSLDSQTTLSSLPLRPIPT